MICRYVCRFFCTTYKNTEMGDIERNLFAIQIIFFVKGVIVRSSFFQLHSETKLYQAKNIVFVLEWYFFIKGTLFRAMPLTDFHLINCQATRLEIKFRNSLIILLFLVKPILLSKSFLSLHFILRDVFFFLLLKLPIFWHLEKKK